MKKLRAKKRSFFRSLVILMVKVKSKNHSDALFFPAARRCFLVLVSLCPVYAADSGAWSGKVSVFCAVLQRIALTGGVVGLAWCAIEYMTGNSESAKKALSKAVIIIGAVIATYALPAMLRLGASIGRSLAWSPASLGS